MTTHQNAVNIFLSYAEKDIDFLQQLEKHTSGLTKNGQISIWYNGQIGAGNDKTRVINQQLEQASIILCLVSADFIASSDCQAEMQCALELYKSGKIQIIPILIRPCDWKQDFLATFQCLPRNEKAITEWKNQDSAWKEVAQALDKIIETIPLQNAPIQAPQKTISEKVSDNERLSQSNAPLVNIPQKPIKPPPFFPWPLKLFLSIIILVTIASLLSIQQNPNRGATPSSSQRGGIYTDVTKTTTFISTPSISMKTPTTQGAQQILSQFCMDLRRGNYADAYSLLNSHMHIIYSTVDQLKQAWVGLNIKEDALNSKDCIAANLQRLNRDTYTGVITLPRVDNPKSARELVTIDDKDVTGIWKVSDWGTAS